MDRDTYVMAGVGVVALVVLYLFLRRDSVSVYGADSSNQLPETLYLTYNLPKTESKLPSLVSYTTDPVEKPEPEQTKSCLCDFGCGDNGEYSKVLNNLMAVFTRSTNALMQAYQGGILAQFTPAMRQYINNDKGFIESRRALESFGTSYGEQYLDVVINLSNVPIAPGY